MLLTRAAVALFASAPSNRSRYGFGRKRCWRRYTLRLLVRELLEIGHERIVLCEHVTAARAETDELRRVLDRVDR